MEKIPFQESELKIVGEFPGRFGGGTVPVYDYPVPVRKAAYEMYMHKQGTWEFTDAEGGMFTPSVIPDNIARGFVFEGGPKLPREKFGGPDMFGVNWVYVDQVGGSMVKPGAPLMEDANEWREKVVFPDIDSWDWEGSAAMNREYLAKDKPPIITFLNGCWFERLISFMDFEGAAMALLDEDQIDAVKELTHALTDLYIRIAEKCFQYYDLDGVCIHDDWGSQQAPFFSDRIARELYLPEMKRFNDYVHSQGKYVELHSCGHVEDRCDVFAEAGFDAWLPMSMNDTPALYEKYGDRIVIGVAYDKPFDPETATEEEQRAAARDFADRFCAPGKPSSVSFIYNSKLLTPAFREELYRCSRLNYAK